jgi:hypothetical protein
MSSILHSARSVFSQMYLTDCRIYMFLVLLDPDPDPLARDTDPAPGSGSFYHQAKNVKKTLIPTVF